MKRFLLIMLAVLVGATVVGVIGSAAHAQGLTPWPIDLPICEDLEQVDINGDGKLDHLDFDLWVRTLHELTGEECRLEGPASGCPAYMDVNGDARISYDDLFMMEEFLLFCVNPIWSVIDPGG
jgi:hypothetical protein